MAFLRIQAYLDYTQHVAEEGNTLYWKSSRQTARCTNPNPVTHGSIQQLWKPQREKKIGTEANLREDNRIMIQGPSMS